MGGRIQTGSLSTGDLPTRLLERDVPSTKATGKVTANDGSTAADASSESAQKVQPLASSVPPSYSSGAAAWKTISLKIRGAVSDDIFQALVGSSSVTHH